MHAEDVAVVCLSQGPTMGCDCMTVCASVLSEQWGGAVQLCVDECSYNPTMQVDLSQQRQETNPHFTWSRHTIDSQIRTLVATLPCAWHYMISARTG